MGNPIAVELQVFKIFFQALLFQEFADFDQKVRHFGFSVDAFIELLFEFL